MNVSNPFTIKAMSRERWSEVLRIYLEEIATGNATFEAEAPSWGKVGQQSPTNFQADDACMRVWPKFSVYVAEAARGKSLLSALIESSEHCAVWTLQAGIFPENSASITVHKFLGFREVGRRERIGKMGSTWRDVVLLERRSAQVAI